MTNKTAFRFSLVELLVVIAIVSVLMTLLLPALKKSREKALEIGCVNNLKQLYVGLNFYADDHNDAYPHYQYNLVISGSSATNKSTRWFACVGELIGVHPVTINEPNCGAPLVCPATVQRQIGVDLITGRTGVGTGDFYYSSYIISGNIVGYKRRHIRNSVYFVYDGYNGEGWGTVTSPNETLRHGVGLVMLYTDGHAVRLAYKDFNRTTLTDWKPQ